MQQMTLTRMTRTRAHQAEPTPDSFGAAPGGDRFSLDHYPAYGICRVCGGTILAEPYLRTFKHED
jgi:hypothetical protein